MGASPITIVRVSKLPMPLTYTGESTESLNRKLYRATGSQDEFVIVEVSRELFAARGEEAVLQKASDKYDEGQVSTNGRVSVLSTDFE